MYEDARACVSGGDSRFRNDAVEGKGRGNARRSAVRTRQGIARDGGRKEETRGSRWICGR